MSTEAQQMVLRSSLSVSGQDIGDPDSNLFTLIEPEADNGIHPEVTTVVTKASETQLDAHLERCSSRRSLYQTIARLSHVSASSKGSQIRLNIKDGNVSEMYPAEVSSHMPVSSDSLKD